jgi:hypothetical protein
MFSPLLYNMNQYQVIMFNGYSGLKKKLLINNIRGARQKKYSRGANEFKLL